jgi:hypothetical protein
VATNASKETIENVWFDVVKSVVSRDFKVVFSEKLFARDSLNVNGPRPPKPYITLKLITGPLVKGSFDEIRPVPGKPTRSTLSGERQYTMNLISYGEGGVDALDLIQTLMDSPSIRTKFKSDADISIVNRGGITDISALLETGFEVRATLDVVFNKSVNVEIETGAIEGICIDGILDIEDQRQTNVDEFLVIKP